MVSEIDRRPAALLLNGTVGVGKTTVAEAIGDILAQAGIPGAVVDVDWLRRCWPSPADDPFHSRLALRNVASVVASYREVGVTHIVLAGVVETAPERQAHAVAVGLPLQVCRLRVELPLVRQRLAVRQRHDSGGLAWHLARAGELDAILDSSAVDDFAVDATELGVAAAAAAVLRSAGWTRGPGSALRSG